MIKLKYPLWLKIIDIITMVVIPVIMVIIEVLNSPHTGYKFGFMIIILSFTIWMFIRKFMLDKYKAKLLDDIRTLELNHNTGIGDNLLTEKTWKSKQMQLVGFEAITIVLLGVIVYMVIVGLTNALLKFQGAFSIIVVSYFLGMIIKFVYLTLRGKGNEQNNN